MARKSIFDLLAEEFDIENETERIDTLFGYEKVLYDFSNCFGDEYTLKSFVSSVCFDSWKNRGHFIDLSDFLESVHYDDYYEDAKVGDVEAFLALIEIVFNCWKMAELAVSNNENYECNRKLTLLFELMVDNLSRCNHTAIYDEEKEQVLVVEDKPEVTAVAEIVEPNIALELLRYNHHSIRGNIKQKKSILSALGAELEPRGKELASINNSFKDNIFFMLNNLNIRHNNCNPADKSKYKEYVANMDKEELESWYDELYQMILLAFLELEQRERNPKVAELKASIVGAAT